MRKLPSWPWILACAAALWMLVTWPMAMSYKSIRPHETLEGIAVFAVLPGLIGIALLLSALLSGKRLWVLGTSGGAILIVTGWLTYAALGNFHRIQVHRKAERESLTIMSHLSHAMLSYADEHNGRLPRASRWVAEVRQHLADAPSLHCPTNPAPGRVGYGFNASLSGTRLSEISDPERTVMLFEAARPGGNPVGTSDEDVWHGPDGTEPAIVWTVSGNIAVISRNRGRNTPPAPHW